MTTVNLPMLFLRNDRCLFWDLCVTQKYKIQSCCLLKQLVHILTTRFKGSDGEIFGSCQEQRTECKMWCDVIWQLTHGKLKDHKRLKETHTLQRGILLQGRSQGNRHSTCWSHWQTGESNAFWAISDIAGQFLSGDFGFIEYQSVLSDRNISSFNSTS